MLYVSTMRGVVLRVYSSVNQTTLVKASSELPAGKQKIAVSVTA